MSNLKRNQIMIKPTHDGANLEREWKNSWSFIVMADPQIGMLNESEDELDWKEEIRNSTRAVDLINCLKPRPKFVVVCGDLTNAYPNKRPDLCKKQREEFKKIYSKIDSNIRCLCVCGNHDVGNRPNADTIADFNKNFGQDYFGFWQGGVRCLVLNSQLYEAKDENLWASDKTYQQEALSLARDQDKWLEKEADYLSALDHPPRHCIGFCHIPPFLYDADEPKDYFNLRPDIRQGLLGELKRAGVSKLFCGHFHRNAGGHDGTLEVITTTAIGCTMPFSDAAKVNKDLALGLKGFNFSMRSCDGSKSGLRMVYVSEKVINHRFYSLDDFASFVKGQAQL